jgi:hypothetical protein
VVAGAAPPTATDAANAADPSHPTATTIERGGASTPGAAAAAAESGVNENRPEATASRWTLWLTVLVLACAAVAVTVAVVLILSNRNDSSFATSSSNTVASQGKSDDDLADFASHAPVVLEEIEARLTQTLILLDIVAVLMASHAMATNQTWPFVVLPHYGLHASRLLPLAAPVALNVQTMPVVSPELRTVWEAYSAANTNWVDECMAIQETVWRQHTYYGLIQFDSVEDGSSNSRIHDSFGDDLPDTHRYAPNIFVD